MTTSWCPRWLILQEKNMSGKKREKMAINEANDKKTKTSFLSIERWPPYSVVLLLDKETGSFPFIDFGEAISCTNSANEKNKALDGKQ